MHTLKLGAAFAVALFAHQSAVAAEWQADRLRGVVLTMVGDQWTPVAIGDVINDARIIRTGGNGHATFRSGEQVVEMRPNSQIQISSQDARDHTWVLHAGGEIIADVDARDVEHFGVRTHHMVAVVKGTRFTVSAEEDGASVAVDRGTVSVSENSRGLSVSINSGQRASGGSGSLEVEGRGTLPTVVDAQGRPVQPAVAQALNQPAAAVQQDPEQAVPPGVAPGNAGSAAGRIGAAPGNSANAPGRASDHRGNSANAPGRSGEAPGNSGNAPGRSGDGPGNSGNAPGRSGDAPGNSGNAQGNSGNSGGNSGGANSGSGNSGKGNGKGNN